MLHTESVRLVLQILREEKGICGLEKRLAVWGSRRLFVRQGLGPIVLHVCPLLHSCDSFYQAKNMQRLASWLGAGTVKSGPPSARPGVVSSGAAPVQSNEVDDVRYCDSFGNTHLHLAVSTLRQPSVYPVF